MTCWIEDRDAERRHSSEVARAIGLRLFNLQLAKGKSVKAHEFLPFPWDDEETNDGGLSEMTADEKKASLDALMAAVNWQKDGKSTEP